MKLNLAYVVIAILFLHPCAGRGDEMQQEIEAVKQEYWAAVLPLRQSISELPLDDQKEVARRIRIVEDTWPDHLAGRSDATNVLESGRFALQGYASLSQVEQDCTSRLKSKYGIEYAPVETPVTNIHRWIYINVSNSEMENSFSDTQGKFVLGHTLHQSSSDSLRGKH